MNRIISRPRLIISHGPKKKEDFDPPPNLGTLSPDLQPCSPLPFYANENGVDVVNNVGKREYLTVGKYIIRQTVSPNDFGTAIDKNTGIEYLCKV